MSKPLLFSIIIPTYNRENFILNTLDTVFAQTYRHYEIIVVDNCSTDNTIKILEPLASAGKIRLIQHEKNYERARSRNTGMDNAVGDFLTFLDSDDFMYPSTLADASQFALQNPSLKCFHNLYELVDDKQKLLRKCEFPPIGDRIKTIAMGNFMSCIGNFIHRDIYTKYRFDTFVTLTGSEDWEFWLRVLADNDVGRIEKVNCGVLQHENRTVMTNSVENFEAGFEYLLNKIKQDSHLSKVYNNNINKMEINSLLYLGILSNNAKLFDKARNYLKLAAQKDWKVIFTDKYLRVLRRTILKLSD